jgi:hypothetical protein
MSGIWYLAKIETSSFFFSTVFPLELVALCIYLSRAGLQIGTVPAESWVGLFYLTAVSQFIGFSFITKAWRWEALQR